MATVELTIAPEPAHVRTARQVAVAVARRAGLPDETLEDVRLAVSEATGLLLRLDSDGADEGSDRVRLVFADDGPGFVVELSAGAPLRSDGADEAGDDPLSVDAVIAVLDELASAVDVTSGSTGTRLQLRWDGGSAPLPQPS